MRSDSHTDRAARRTRTARCATLAAGLLLAGMAACVGVEPGEAVRVVVPPGASLAVVADSLERTGVIGSARMFRLYAKLTDRDRAVKAGTYELRRGSSWGDVLAALTEGRGVVLTVALPEGMALAAIESLLVARLELPADSVAAAARDSTLRARLDVPTPTLEGYLFPATYTFVPGTTAREAVAEMVRQFERRWRPGWTARLDSLGMTRHQVVTLASIVEKEARVAQERPVIAAVYHNRLKVRMPLQADPTVQYALGTHVDRVLYKHLETDSPYNTYRYAGLPPGPIASPGTASIVAALYPAPVRYLYFVARPDGRHEFRSSFAEHTRARAEVQRMRNARPAAPTAPRNARD